MVEGQPSPIFSTARHLANRAPEDRKTHDSDAAALKTWLELWQRHDELGQGLSSAMAYMSRPGCT